MYKRHDIDVNAWNDPMFFSQSDLVQARRLFLGDRMGEGSEGHEAVRSAFDRFDVDQTGSISRDELGGLLKSLSPEWDDAAIDQMLSTVDLSGDGQIQMQEFLQWIFYDDPGLFQAGELKCFCIEGCSRKDLNGHYVLEQGTKYCGRPVYYCAKTMKYLFFNRRKGKPDQWQVHPELNFRALCRLRTSKEPDSQGPWVVNHGLQDVGGKKTWVWEQEDQMSCREVDLLAEELRASAPPIIHQPLTFGKTGPLGLYRKTDQIFNDRPVYYSQKSKLYIFYQKAQVGKRADGTWGALPDRDKMNRWKRYYYVKETCPAISFSSATQGFSPITATWRTRDGEVLKWTCPDPSKCPERKVKDPDEEDLEPVPAGWKDPDFPHESSSCKSSDQDKEFKWLRAYELSRNLSGDFTATLFGEGTEPADACQGAICNCWLMAAISKLAEYPGVIESLFSPKEASLEGKYEIRLCKEFTGGKTEWTVVTIDDYLPCKYGKPIYAKFHKGKMYVALLEKAIAKLMDGDKQRGRLTFEGKGTYASFFSGGMNNFAWSMMTGLYGYTCYGPPHGEDRAQWQALENLAVTTDPSEEETEELGVLGAGATIQEVELWRCYVKFQKMSGEGPEEGWVPSYILGRRVAKRISKFPWHIYVPEPFEGSYDAKPVEEEWVWEKMMEFDKDNSLVDVSLTYRRSSAELKQDGLLVNHGYTWLHAIEVDGWRMVCLRNPWGRWEYRGPWNDLDDAWDANPAVKAACFKDNYARDDGIFWMEFDDYKYNFKSMTVMPFAVPKRALNSEDEG